MSDLIRIMKKDADISVVNIDLIRRRHFICRFKCKLYSEGYNNALVYFHKEYIYRSKMSKEDRSVNLSPNSFITITLKDEDSKADLYVTEVSKHILFRKLIKPMANIEAYLSGEFTNMITDDGEINSRLPGKSGIVTFSKYRLQYDTVIREATNDVGIKLIADDTICEISAYDFLDLCYKLRGLDFMSMTMQCINYVRRPMVGMYETDLRTMNIDIPDDSETEPVVKKIGKQEPNLSFLDFKPRKIVQDQKRRW